MAGGDGRASVLALARVRVRVAHRDYTRSEIRPEEWLLIEWPEGEEKPAKYWLFDPAEKHLLPQARWTSPNCVGESSAIIKSSNKRSGSDISKDEAGAASTTMPRCAIAAYGFLSPRGRGFPPHDLVTPLGSKKLAVPEGDRSGAPPPRTERHVPNSDRDDAQKIDHRACQQPFHDAHAAPRLSPKARA